jgi:uncharacterized membrane protein
VLHSCDPLRCHPIDQYNNHVRKMDTDDEMVLAAALLATVVALLFLRLHQHMQSTAPATMKLRWFRLQKGRALHYIMPLSLSETMESLMKRAQDRHFHMSFVLPRK